MALFFRVLSEHDKGTALARLVEGVRAGRAVNPAAYSVEPDSFRQIPGSPFAYWVSERVRRLFVELQPYEGDGRTAKVGLGTLDDFRFLRCWWECAPSRMLKSWYPLVNGGQFSRFFGAVPAAVWWEENGLELKRFVESKVGSASRKVQAESFYFRPGLTWPLRGIVFSAQAVPEGCIFSNAGKMAFARDVAELLTFLGLFNSAMFDYLLRVFAGKVGGVQYEAGLIQQVPIPELGSAAADELGRLAEEGCALNRLPYRSDEISHAYLSPSVVAETGRSIADRATRFSRRIDCNGNRLREIQARIDEIAFDAYGIDGDERDAIRSLILGRQAAAVDVADGAPAESEEEDASEAFALDRPSLTRDLLSYAVGCVFGRWNLRLATGETRPAALPNPFTPLPVCSPGMLTGSDSLPAREAPPGYLLRIDWDGILVDDPSPDGNSPHQDDIVRRVREVLELLFGDRHEAIEKEACEFLGAKDLRDYFRYSNGFFTDHIKRYSKSRRKAPIYWLLQSSKRSYGLWLYYHRLDRDTIFKALRNYVLPKINGETTRLREMTKSLDDDKASLSRSQCTKREKAIEKQEALLTELTAFKDTLERVAALGYDPDLNDGVVLNIAPFHEITPWKVAKQYWDELCEGKYEWSTMSKRLREKGLVAGG